MNNKTIGGGDWRYNPSTGAGQKGITGAVGLNSIGLLVRTQGKIVEGVEGSLGPIKIDDGSGAPVWVALPSGKSSPGIGIRLAVTGVVSCVTEHKQIVGPPNPVYVDVQTRKILAVSMEEIDESGPW
jgi:hypothetical protein